MRRSDLAWPVAFSTLGLLMAFHPTILSGLARMQWDPGDTRFLLVTLEHSWRWLTGWPHHGSFWDTPIFFPASNVASYSDVLITVAPLFWVWRLLGFPPDTALQLWMLSGGLLNFVAAWLFLRNVLRFADLPASAGAFFFAFAAARINQLGHQQLLCHFFTIGVLYSLGRVLDPPAGWPRWREAVHVFLGPLFLAAQLYAGVYLGWFLLLALGAALPMALLFGSFRQQLLRALARHGWLLPFALGLAALAMWPFYAHYLAARDQVGNRSWGEVSAMLPRWESWLDPGPYSWLYWRWGYSSTIRELPFEWEQRLAPGLVTAGLALLGLLASWRRPVFTAAAASGLLLAALSLHLGDGFSLWRYVYDHVPAAGAIRTVCRIGLLVWIPFMLGLAQVASWLRPESGLSAGRRLTVGLALALAMLEQGLTTPAYDKLRYRRVLQGFAAQLSPDCPAFLFTPTAGRLPGDLYNLDAMMISVWANVPTLNGYSGNTPPGWFLHDPRLHSPRHRAGLEQWVEAWRAQHGGRPERVCWLSPDADDGRFDARFLGGEVPTTLRPGERRTIQLDWLNSGEVTWAPSWGFRIGAEGNVWGTNRVWDPAYVDPGRPARLRFDITAPATAGTYTLSFRPLMEGQFWFGEPSRTYEIEVR